jgi:DNA repair exonuclease SbcCD ATPase subunit
MKNERFRINRLEIEGFRGYNGAKTIDFGKPVTLLFGNNGCGKSSTLGAIEWCLFNDFASVRCETRTKDELINDHNPTGKCKVTLVISSNKKSYEITREKEIGHLKSNLIIRTPNGEELSGVEAENFIPILCGIEFEDFLRAIYLHQEDVRGLITEDREKRDDTLDRLFGLETLRNIVESIPTQDIRKAVTQYERRQEKTESEIRGAAEKCEIDLQKFLKKAREEKIAVEHMNIGYCKKLYKDIVNQIHGVSKELFGEEKEFIEINDNKSFESFCNQTKRAVSQYRKRLIPKVGTDELISKRDRIDQELRNYRSKLKEIRKIRGEKSELRNEAKINLLLKKNETEKLKIKTMRDRLGIYAQLIGLSLNYLEKFSPTVCPICERTIDSKIIIRKLGKRKGEQKKAESFTKSIERLDKSTEKLREELYHLDSLTKRLEPEIKEAQRIRERLGKLDIKTEREARKILGELSTKIRQAERAYRNKEGKLSSIDKKTERLKLIHSILEARETKRNIDKLFPEKKKEITSLGRVIQSARGIQKNVQNIISICNKVSKTLADNRIRESMPKIAKFYSAFSHQYYKRLVIELSRKKVKGSEKNTYIIKAINEKEGKETPVSTKFSTGQMNCVALAIYLSMSMSLAHKLGFLILDDPSQTLDTGHKISLVDKFKRIGKNTQLIISTQDSEFQKLLSNRIGQHDRNPYNFNRWSKIEGPEIIKTR